MGLLLLLLLLLLGVDTLIWLVISCQPSFWPIAFRHNACMLASHFVDGKVMNLTFFGAIRHFITWTAQFATSSRTNGKTVHDADLPVNIAHEFVGYLVIFSL
jgi:hypothetical protein